MHYFTLFLEDSFQHDEREGVGQLNTIYLEDSVFQTLSNHPELKDLLVEIGFKPLNQPQMVQTVGRITSLKKGSKIAKIPLETIIDTLEMNGYVVKERRD